MLATVEAISASFEVRVNGFELLGCRNVKQLLRALPVRERLGSDNWLTLHLARPTRVAPDSLVRVGLEGDELPLPLDATARVVDAQLQARWDPDLAVDAPVAVSGRVASRAVSVTEPVLTVPFAATPPYRPQRWERADQYSPDAHRGTVLSLAAEISRSLAAGDRAAAGRIWARAENDANSRASDLNQPPISRLAGIELFLADDSELDPVDQASIVIRSDPSRRVIWLTDRSGRSVFRKRSDGLIHELLVYLSVHRGEASVVL
jgi:hypothetical protein